MSARHGPEDGTSRPPGKGNGESNTDQPGGEITSNGNARWCSREAAQAALAHARSANSDVTLLGSSACQRVAREALDGLRDPVEALLFIEKASRYGVILGLHDLFDESNGGAR